MDLGRNRGKPWWAEKAADRLSSCGESAAKALPPLLRANYRKAFAERHLPKDNYRKPTANKNLPRQLATGN
jgi:hypothetical protein